MQNTLKKPLLIIALLLVNFLPLEAKNLHMDYETSLITSPARIMILLKEGATIDQVNNAIHSVAGTVIGTLPLINLMLIEIADNSDSTGLENALKVLEADPNVVIAVPDTLIDVASIPAPSSAYDPYVKDSSSNVPAGLNPNPWIWNLPPSTGTITDGNWGLEALRIPQIWNLNDYVKRASHNVLIAILDAGFQNKDSNGWDDHPDLANLRTIVLSEEGALSPGARTSAHGQHVAGIIGATFNNGLGIDGVNPFTTMIGISPPSTRKGPWTSSWSTILATLIKLLQTYPEIRVVNISMAYNWPVNTRLKVDPNFDKGAQEIVMRQGLLMRLVAATFPDVLFISAAGNDSPKRFQYPYEILAKWASPLNWAALGSDIKISFSEGDSDEDLFRKSPNIIVVESFDSILPGEASFRKSDFSNVGGHISAPGGRILSTVLNGKYDTFDGTSMAAPHLSGLVGYLLAFDPTLSVQEIKELLLRSSRPIEDETAGGRGPNGEGPAPRIDAFDAILGIDAIRPSNPVQRALVDVDDCSLDGNQRIDDVGNDFAGYCSDGLRGDRNIDMKDFRAFRDALIYVEGRYRHNLDGKANNPKKDLNGDGCIHDYDPASCPIEENVYPRFDFNGDGQISRNNLAEFKGQQKIDLQVLMDVWGSGPNPDTEGWEAEDLPKLLDSADLHVDLSPWFSLLGLEKVVLSISYAPSNVITPEAPKVIITVPAFTTIMIEAKGMKGNEVITAGCAIIGPLEPGEDVNVELKDCS